MVTSFDRSKSLQDRENYDWGEPNDDSYLVTICHRLRRVPLARFEIEDLRIMIGQRIGLQFLISLAIEKLERDPLSWRFTECYSESSRLFLESKYKYV